MIRYPGVMKVSPNVETDPKKWVNTDPYYEQAVKNVAAAVKRLQEMGIIDEHGNRIRKDLPEDMQEGKDRDFGG